MAASKFEASLSYRDQPCLKEQTKTRVSFIICYLPVSMVSTGLKERCLRFSTRLAHPTCPVNVSLLFPLARFQKSKLNQYGSPLTPEGQQETGHTEIT